MDRFISMQIFMSAVEEGSFAAAARRFKLSAAMAGKHVSAIESDLNVRLIQRSTRRLSLTDVGQRYYERCKVILEAVEDANREARDVGQHRAGYFALLRRSPSVQCILGRSCHVIWNNFRRSVWMLCLKTNTQTCLKIELMLPSGLGVLTIRRWLPGGWRLARWFYVHHQII